MSDTPTTIHDADDRIMLTTRVLPVIRTAQVIAAIGFIVALVYVATVEPNFKRFYHAYLTSFMFFLSIALGSLFFVMIQHLTKAGWSVAVRRVAEVCAATMPMMTVAFAPIAVAVLANEGELYPWAKQIEHHHHHDEGPGHKEKAGHARITSTTSGTATAVDPAAPEKPQAERTDVRAHTVDAHTEELFIAKKHGYLNPTFFLARCIIYFFAWTALALWMWRNSTQQDKTGDLVHTRRMQSVSAPGVFLFALTVTFGAFDLLMSLSPAWYSTIFGVYYFTGSMGAAFATIILALNGLQKLGFLTNSITKEHYHDLGKYLFGFTFFWGYIAFSQYMLIWYANMPETTFWFAQRGASTNPDHFTNWSIISLILPIGHFAIPFAGLLSRHIKRNKDTLVFWAVWVLVFHWIDMFWIVMPEYSSDTITLGVPEVATFWAVAGVFTAMALRLAKMNKLIPVKDPRLEKSLAFENI